MALCAMFGCFGASTVGANDAPAAATASLERHLATRGDLQTWQSPDPLQLRPGQRGDRPLPLYRALVERPLQAMPRLAALADDLVRPDQSVHEHLLRLSRLAGPEVRRAAPVAAPAGHDRNGDPLAQALAGLALARGEPDWSLTLPDDRILPPPLRDELASVLDVFGQVERFRRVAFAKLPTELDAGHLLRQVTRGELAAFMSPDFRTAIGSIDLNALFAGMQDLVAAVEALVAFLSAADLPPLAWRLDTPMGAIVVDTTGGDNRYALEDLLLLIDTAGNDEYLFRSTKSAPGLAVLIDLAGDDRYHAFASGADPSAAVLGYGLLWDAAGDDRHMGEQLAQGAALFGVGLLVDGGGDDHYQAQGHAQSFALGGGALLLERAGNDRYDALTHAQGSAGPQAAALLLEQEGDDDYRLGNAPLVMPSPQNPARNVSMGQGAGWGWRAEMLDGRSLAGGFGALVDMAGHDRYEAQVFAQGVGYWEGVGLLVDDAGDNHFDLAWYGLGAAAHAAVGVAMLRGEGDDTYVVRQNAALGTGNDRAIALFRDASGSDRYELTGMGLAAVLDDGLAVFEDVSGDDEYVVHANDCRVFGHAGFSTGRTALGWLPSSALFDPVPAKGKFRGDCAPPGRTAVDHGPSPVPMSAAQPLLDE